MKIALFGGTFDPIHNAHIALAEACREQLCLDEVWLMVTPQNPWKQDSTLSDNDHRLRMAQLAVEGHPGLVASDYEFRLEKPTYTYLTLRHLRHDYPDHEFILLIGGDNWAAFDHWSHYEEILQHHPVAVYPRYQEKGNRKQVIGDMPLLAQQDTGNLLSSVSYSLYNINAPLLPISSTSIRRQIAENSPITDLVPPAVEEYIHENRLYLPLPLQGRGD